METTPVRKWVTVLVYVLVVSLLSLSLPAHAKGRSGNSRRPKAASADAQRAKLTCSLHLLRWYDPDGCLNGGWRLEEAMVSMEHPGLSAARLRELVWERVNREMVAESKRGCSAPMWAEGAFVSRMTDAEVSRVLSDGDSLLLAADAVEASERARIRRSAEARLAMSPEERAERDARDAAEHAAHEQSSGLEELSRGLRGIRQELELQRSNAAAAAIPPLFGGWR